jgi:esterase/lipase
VYYNNDQNILKVKSAHYLYLHRAKSEISSIEKVIDVYMDWFITKRFVEHSDFSYTSFFAYLEEKFDYEIATMARGHASRICDAMKEVEKIMNALFKYAADCKDMSRKDAAMKIMQAYGSTGRSSIIFKLMDGKVIGTDDWKKILYQVLK